MRLTKMLGLAAVAAVAAMAFLGAGTASATSICLEANASVNGSGEIVCSTPIQLLKIKGTISNAKLDVGANGITCETLHVKGQLHLFTGPMRVTVLSLSFVWLNCKSTVPFCEGAATVTTPNEALEGEVTYTAKKYASVGAGEATVTINNPATTVVLSCLGIKTTCKYEPATITGTSLNSTHELTVSQAVKSSSGGLCPEGTELAKGVLNMGLAGAGESGAEGANFVLTS